MSEKRKIRFGVRAEDGRRSRVWSVNTVAKGGDVYLKPHGAPANFHFSLHSDDYWHMKMVRAVSDPRLAPEEETPFDVIPRPGLDGLTRAFVVAIAPDGLSHSDESAARVLWQPPASSPQHSSVFSLFLEPPGFASLLPEGVMKRIARGDGGFAVVTHHEEVLDTLPLVVPEDMRDARGEEIASGRASAMLVLLNDDDSWRIVEGGVEPRGADGFDIASDRPWFPERPPSEGNEPSVR